MSAELVVAIVTGLGGMLSWGLSDFFAKKSLEKVGPLALTFWIQVLGVLPLLVYVVAKGNIPSLSLATFGGLVVFGLAEAASDILMYRGFSKGKVSILSPIFASYAGLVVIFSALLFGELIPTYVLTGLVIILVGVILINVDFKDLRMLWRKPAAANKGVGEVLGATVIYALWLVIYAQFVKGQDGIFYLLMIRSIEVLWLLGFARFTKGSLRVRGGGNVWPYIALVGFTDIVAYALTTYGFGHSHYTSIIAVLGAAFSLPTVLLAHMYLKERIMPSQIFAIITIVVGVAIVASV